MHKLLKKTSGKPGKYLNVFVAAVLLSFHYYIITYVNSTFLEGVVGRDSVGILYAIGSFINIIIFLKAASLIKKYGSYNFIIFFSILEIVSLLFLAFNHSIIIIISAFIVHQFINPIILACLDTDLEDTGDIKHIGKTRGTFLTIISIASVTSPLAIGSLVTNGDFSKVYLFSVLFMSLFLVWVIRNLKNIPGGQFKKIQIISELKEFVKNKKIRNISFCATILQFFYSWMVIYIPIYLVKEMGFSWSNTALIISVSLLPFLFFEIPVGELVDKKSNERKMLIFGFLLSSLALLTFPLVPKGALFLWCLVIFIARTGASIVETSGESYFFKEAYGKDELIEIFRISGPFAFIIGPLLGSVLVTILPFQYIFPALSVVMLLGVYFASTLRSNL